MKIKDIEVIVTGGREIPPEECAAYVDDVKAALKPNEEVRRIELHIPQDSPGEVEISCIVHKKSFMRIWRAK